MVASAKSTGHFGSAARKLLYGVGSLPKDVFVQYVRKVHALTQEATQRTLSVKAGDKPLNYWEFNKHVLKPLRNGEKPASGDKLPEALAVFLATSQSIRDACNFIAETIRENPAPPWCTWLYSPSKLGAMLEKDGCLQLPLDDPRVIALLVS